MSRRHRIAVAAWVSGGLFSLLVLVAFAGAACPGELPRQPCPDATTNRVVVIGLAAISATLLVTPFAYLAEFLARGRIVYRGVWARAARRGVLAGAVLVVLAGLRLGDALSVPVVLFVLVLAGLAEWFAARR